MLTGEVELKRKEHCHQRGGDDRQPFVQQIADDVSSLAWFFHKPNLKVLVIAYTQDEEGKQRYKIGPVPKDWYYTVQTLETDINRALDENNKEYPDNYYRDKRPDIFEEKK